MNRDALYSSLKALTPRSDRSTDMKLSLALALLPAASAFAPSRSGARATTVTNIAVGDSVPADTVLVKEFPFDTIDVPARLAGKKTIVLGLPGAFTPT